MMWFFFHINYLMLCHTTFKLINSAKTRFAFQYAGLPFRWKMIAKNKPPLINMGADTGRIFSPRLDTNECCQEVKAPRGGQVVVWAAVWWLQEVWIVSKVYPDKVHETASGTEGSGQGPGSRRESSFKSTATQAAWLFDSGWRQREHCPGSLHLLEQHNLGFKEHAISSVRMRHKLSCTATWIEQVTLKRCVEGIQKNSDRPPTPPPTFFLASAETSPMSKAQWKKLFFLFLAISSDP